MQCLNLKRKKAGHEIPLQYIVTTVHCPGGISMRKLGQLINLQIECSEQLCLIKTANYKEQAFFF